MALFVVKVIHKFQSLAHIRFSEREFQLSGVTEIVDLTW